MSVRHAPRDQLQHVTRLQKELSDLKAAATASPAAEGLSAEGAVAAPGAPSFDDLSGVEKSAASLGVHPDSWRPIGFLNNAHFGALLANNQLVRALLKTLRCTAVRIALVIAHRFLCMCSQDEDLARRINAYATVAKASSA